MRYIFKTKYINLKNSLLVLGIEIKRGFGLGIYYYHDSSQKEISLNLINITASVRYTAFKIPEGKITATYIVGMGK